MPEWAKPSFTLSSENWGSYFMLDYADVSLGNVQASEYFDSAKIQL